ncbi:hypothetical protein [Streptomyces yanii]|uniref:Uncharacterized protein n=1 Tax=Streptomyces yanii TaxID=78510 RepID=A0ABV5RK65_9ACTN
MTTSTAPLTGKVVVVPGGTGNVWPLVAVQPRRHRREHGIAAVTAGLPQLDSGSGLGSRTEIGSSS